VFKFKSVRGRSITLIQTIKIDATPRSAPLCFASRACKRLCAASSTAIVVVVAYALSESGRHLRKDTAFLHFAFGLIVLMLTAGRFVARAFGRSAPRLATVAPWLVRLGKSVHTLLYLLLIAVPLTGWYSASQMGMPAKLFTLTLPALTMPSSNGKPGAVGGLHQLGGNLILLLAGLHLAGVL
jgi:cytochrome b561